MGEASEFFLDSIQQPASTSVRLNPNKPGAQFENTTAVPWCNLAYTLAERPEFIFDPLIHAGAYYVQESSSMFLDHVFRNLPHDSTKPIKVLDLCAAPGGKSTLINSCLKPNDLLVSNEIIKARASILEENLMKWGQPNTVITQNDPKDFAPLKHFFDVIVIDAPCSGEGLFRRDKNAMNEWSLSNVALCEARQQRIVADVIDCLKPGGFLIYSTCTYNLNENEYNVRWMKQTFGLQNVSIPIPETWPIAPSLTDDVVAYRFLPHKVSGEGLFMACLQKPEEDVVEHRFKPIPTKTKINQTQVEVLNSWVQGNEQYLWFDVGMHMMGIPLQHERAVGLLMRLLYVKNAGVNMGSFAGKELIPSHHLALSNCLSQSIQRIDLTKEEAIRYLRKDVLQLASNTKGWTALTYQNLPLGWAKMLPNRLNNYLPANLRILKEYKYS
jgi:16S rRNA C967 or C1407 C5-methylase (RsmB/RsmF family)/NOL1/NOP2/fmu family ribosome biogenesis protein